MEIAKSIKIAFFEAIIFDLMIKEVFIPVAPFYAYFCSIESA